MARVSVDLRFQTDPAWAGYVLERFDAFLADHASCERKASASAMSLVARYPERTAILPMLIALAREELEHFEQVYALMEARGVSLAPEAKDPYVNALLALCRDGREARFLDRLLIASLIECRSAERFRLLYEALDDPALKTFYRTLWACEAKHGNVFVAMALRCVPEDTVYARLDALVDAEAEIVARLPWRAAVH